MKYACIGQRAARTNRNSSRASVVGLPPPRLFDKDRDWRRDFLMIPTDIYTKFWTVSHKILDGVGKLKLCVLCGGTFHVTDSPLPRQSIPDIRHPTSTLYPDSSGKYLHNRDRLHTSEPNENANATTYHCKPHN